MLFLLILLNLCNSYWGFTVNFSRQLPSHLHAVKDLVVSSPTSSPQAEPNHPPKREINIPTVGLGKDQYDVFSRLLKDRILILGSDVNDEVANVMVSQMLYLAAEDPFRDITLYINSPGGSVQAGLAIFDTMQYIPCDVSTVCFGAASSMGAFLLAAGTKGKRKSLPSSRIMIHQPLGGSQGEASELQIAAKLLVHTKECLNAYLADFCNQPVDKIAVDTDRDFYMSPEEAKEYGIIDEVIQHKRTVRKPKVPDLMIQPPLPFHDRNYLAEIKKSAREPLQADPWRFRESK